MDRLTRSPARRRRGGFTLIEVMVALGILAAGLLAAAAAQVHAMQSGSSGRHASDAAAIANSQLENFQRLAFDDPALNATGGAWAPAGGQQVQTVVQTTPVDAVEMTYTVQWRIQDVDPNLKTVDVRVQWAEPRRPNRAVTLTTMMHNDPPTEGS